MKGMVNMKNVEIKKMLQGAVKYADEYTIKVWAWQDGETTWAEVIAMVDGEWDCDNCHTFLDYETTDLTADQEKEMFGAMKKLAKYLEKHFENVELENEIQWV
jgi:hypothetical protein